MSMTVGESSLGEMVKAPATRKARQHQTAVERWSSLKQNSERSFDRLNLRNRFEEDRLLEKHRHITQLSDAQLKEIFRVKDEMRVALIDIAKSKRQYNSNESDFESQLRSGKRSPMFKMEYRRLKRKTVELEKLGEQLKGPNAKLLASNLTSELRSVDQKAEKEMRRGESKYKGKWLAPLKKIQKAAANDDIAEGQSTDIEQPPPKSPGTDFANLVLMVHKQLKETSISENTLVEASHDNSVKSENNGNVESKTRLPSLQSISQETKRGDFDNSLKPSNGDGLYPVSRPPKSLIPIAATCSELPKSDLDDGVDRAKPKKRQRKGTKELSLPTLPELSEAPPPPSPQTDPEPKQKRNKKQKARGLLKKSVHQESANAPISRTESARRRDKFVRKRLSDLAIKTKEDIANRRSISPNEDALNSIHQAEVVTRLQLARSKVGIALPELRRDKKRKSEVARTPRDHTHQTAVSLPPLNLEGNLLRQLKEQRRKHKNQSTGLPKLP